MKIKDLFSCSILLTSFVLILVSCDTDQDVLDDGSPVITGFSPQQGKIGEEVTIKGINLGDKIDGTLVEFSSANARVVSVTPTQIVAIVPFSSKTGPIKVENKNGIVSSSQHFTVDTSDDLNFPGIQREGAVSFVLNDKAYVSSGAATTQHLTDLWEYNFATATWTQKADVPGMKTRGFCFVLDGKAYVGGGILDGRTWQYDPTTDTWNEKAAYYRALGNAVSFVINGRAFVGANGDDYNGSAGFLEYIPETDEWVSRASIPGGSRRYATGFSLKGKGYIGLGIDDDNQILTDMYEYDPDTDIWVRKADFGDVGLYGAEAFVINGKAYVGLGNNGKEFSKDVFTYDPQTDKWSFVKKFTGAGRYRATSFVINEAAYIGTGYDDVNTLNDFWKFKP